MAIFKKIIILMSSVLLILGSIQGCSKPDESKDLSITEAVVNKIKTDAKVPEEMVTVEVKEGVVTLNGAVNTAEEEKHLISIAESIEGVKNVNSRLVVKETTTVKEQIPVPAPQTAPQAPPAPASQTGTMMEPSTPSTQPPPTQPSAQPTQDKMMAPHNDMPTSSSSTVTQPPANIEDVAITARVKSILMADPAYQNVMVETQSGVVTITGTVNSQADADAMVKKATAIEGVKIVDSSKVTVKPSSQ